ncbi:MAG: hypothetical protein IPG58_19875 [Acidobacteria bacterium]|nr:hypothetical protein [Acidobacteriota bacterium]
MTNKAGFHASGNSTETEVVNIGQAGFTPGGFTPSAPQVEVPHRSGVSPLLLVGLGIAVLFGLGAIALFLVGPTIGGGGETLPSHLGMFVQSDSKDKVDEIRRQDFTNAIEARAALTKDGSLPYLIAQPNLILYADGKDTPVNDVRLVQLDTLKDDGTMKTLDFQVAPIDGKNDMKRIRIPTQLATGKYAFIFFDGYFNEGKHKFWPFQVKDSAKTDNGDALKAWSVGPKPKTLAAAPAPQAPSNPTSSVATAMPPMPPGPPRTGLRSVNGNGVRVRTGPGSSHPFHPTFRLNRSSQVNVVNYVGYECPQKERVVVRGRSLIADIMYIPHCCVRRSL